MNILNESKQEHENVFIPLEKYTSKEIWDGLMFMGIQVVEQNKIYLYKHFMTRRYINIDMNGKFYMYTGNDDNPYVEINKEDAVNYVLS